MLVFSSYIIAFINPIQKADLQLPFQVLHSMT